MYSLLKMLNCFRVHNKRTPISDDDMKVLEERSNAIKPDDVLHVYSKNKDVDLYNKIMLEHAASFHRWSPLQNLSCRALID